MKKNQGNQKTRSKGKGPRGGFKRCPICGEMSIKAYVKIHCEQKSS